MQRMGVMEGGNVTALSTISGVVADGDESKGPHPNELECHLCLKPPTNPVATSCGHVFCWSCVFPLVVDKRKQKPCPMCGTFLSRDMNILPLYCGEESTEDRASLGKVIPPRPSNPRMFVPWFARVEDSNSDGLDHDTQVSMSVLQQIKQEINRERARNGSMVMEFKREEERMFNDNVRVELVRMERKLMQEKSQMVLDIARLEGQLARATDLLPNGWSDLTILNSIKIEASLHDASSPSNHSH